MAKILPIALILVAVASGVGTIKASDAPLPESLAVTASKLGQKALNDPAAFAFVESLTTEIGQRLAGTEAHKRAVAFLYDTAHRDESVAILVKETKIEPAIAAKNYELYLSTRPFNDSANIPAASVMGVIEVIRADLHDQSSGADKYVALKYLPD